ncbi:formimidoylglutamase [Bdellovibrio sp. HCB337]|uniref:formimidoylglutamase n=1 Tax=Bdellovibrio sp. HCB337 TaxID=3394358 RepID=UPI0039A518DE
MAWTTSTDSKLFFSRQDPKDPRLGEWVTGFPLHKIDDLKSIKASSWAILGYPDDEGIAMNGGRVGAKDAPQMIRTSFYKMTPSLLNPARKDIADLGNVPTDLPLAERHERGRETIKAALDLGLRTISLGGGHDYGYADGAGFIDHCLSKNQRPVLINFDAHLDVRPTDKGFHSGTPFYRLLSQYDGKIDFIEVGLQNQCNSVEHLQWAKSKGAKTLLLQDIRDYGLKESLMQVLAPLKGRACLLSVDIDAFASAEAPGCSQSWTTGLHIQEFLPTLKALQSDLDVKSLAIYEVSPPLDQDNRTSKLAALIMHHALFHS